MSFARPTTMGVVACPGGENFAREVISHLKNIHTRRYEKKVMNLSQRYGISKDEIIRMVNMDLDLHTNELSHSGPVDNLAPPKLKVPARFTRFANGEFKTEIMGTVRGMDLFIVQDVSNHYPLQFYGGKEKVSCSVNDHMICLITAIDAAKQAGAESVTVVVPAYPYSRQHKKKGREGLTASRFGKIMEHLDVTRIITLDIHSKEIENTFDKLLLENLHASYQILRKFSELVDPNDPDIVVVSPDTGAIDRNKYFASNLRRPLALLYKERDYSKLSTSATETNITSSKLLGEVKGKTVFMADDMLGTGGTLIKAMRLMKDMGAKDIIPAVSLPLFTGEAIRFFDEAYAEGLFKRIIGTNAVYHSKELQEKEWYCSANVSNLFARAISRLHHNRSLSSLLDNSKIIQKLLNKGQNKAQ
jgi:ribose-phosphate pyrophosphokinase